MIYTDLTADLARRGITIDLIAGEGPGPRLITDAPRGAIDDELGDAIRHHRDLLIIAVLCRRTGHVFAPCTSCGQPSAVHAKSATWPACRMTYGCNGHHEPRPVDLTDVSDVERPKQAAPPARASRRRPLGNQPQFPTTP